MNSSQAELPPSPPAPNHGHYVFSVSSDGRCILAILIGIMPDSSSGETSHIINDSYGHIYFTTTRLLLYPIQDKLQAYNHHIES